MNLPQVGDRTIVRRELITAGDYTIGHEYEVTRVEYPDAYGMILFYLLGDDGDDHPFFANELNSMEIVTPIPPSWSL